MAITTSTLDLLKQQLNDKTREKLINKKQLFAFNSRMAELTTQLAAINTEIEQVNSQIEALIASSNVTQDEIEVAMELVSKHPDFV